MTNRSSPAAVLAAASAAAQEPLQPLTLGAWQSNQVAAGTHVVAYLGTDDRSRQRIRVEHSRLLWAAAAGVPVPRVYELAPDARWLLVERAPDDQRYGEDYVHAAFAAAATIAAAGPPPAEAGEPRARRARRSDLPVRAIRAALSPLRFAEFRSLRAEVADLDAGTTSHGDFHIGNVLSSGGRAVTIVDFEFLGDGHPALDLMSLWVDLEESGDRALLLELACAELPVARSEILLVGHWLAVRHLAELVTGVSLRQRDQPEVRIAVARIEEIRDLRGLG